MQTTTIPELPPTADGHETLLYILRHEVVSGTDEQLYHAQHAAYVALRYREDENPALVAALSRAQDGIAATLRARLRVANAAAKAQAAQPTPSTPNPTSGGAKVPRTPIIPVRPTPSAARRF